MGQTAGVTSRPTTARPGRRTALVGVVLLASLGVSAPALAASGGVSRPAATAPTAPTISRVAPGESELVVTLTSPRTSGGARVLGYVVTALDSAGHSVSASSTSHTVTLKKLTDATTYTLTAKAYNSVGFGPASAAVTGVPVAGPVALTLVAGPTFVPVNTRVSFNGMLTRSTLGVAGEQIFVSETYSDGVEVPLGVTTTSATGRYDFTTTPIYNGTISFSGLSASASTPSRVILAMSTPRVAAAHGRSITVTDYSAPGFVTGPGRSERFQLLALDGSGHIAKVLGLVTAAQRSSQRGFLHGVNVATFHVVLPRPGSFRLAVKALGTPVNTGATSKAITLKVADV